MELQNDILPVKYNSWKITGGSMSREAVPDYEDELSSFIQVLKAGPTVELEVYIENQETKEKILLFFRKEIASGEVTFISEQRL